MSNVECIPCQKGKYASAKASTSCDACIGSSTYSEGAVSPSECSICDIGYFGDLPSIPCTICPAGAAFRCSGDSKVPYISPGYFRTSAATVVACIPAGACAYTGTEAITTCAEGYVGQFCGVCDSQYYRSAQECKKCPNTVSRVFTWLAIAAFLLFLFFRFLWRDGSISVDTRIILQAVQIIAFYNSLTTKWPPLVKNLLSVLSFTVGLFIVSDMFSHLSEFQY
jgi:hypothetical protein